MSGLDLCILYLSKLVIGRCANRFNDQGRSLSVVINGISFAGCIDFQKSACCPDGNSLSRSTTHVADGRNGFIADVKTGRKVLDDTIAGVLVKIG